MLQTPLKRSIFFANGAPIACKECGTKFDGHAWRSNAGYFCSQFCADGFEDHQTLEDRARSVQ